jgi:CRISPR-associated protein Csb2
MPLSILVRLRGGGYDAGGERPSDSEWPPHPARVFCALAASAEGDADWAALRWLEQQELPQVWADPVSQVGRSRTRGYVVQNAVTPEGGNLTWPGRTNGLRTRASTVPSRDTFAVVWPQALPSADIVNRLSLLAWKVPYVGRSTSTAQVAAIDGVPAGMPDAVVYEPAELGRPGQFWDLRVPYAGYTDALRDAYADGRRSWEVAQTRPYAVRGRHQEAGAAGRPQAVPGPFADLLVWAIERPVARVGGDLVVSLTSALRRAVLSRVPDPLPGQVSGHTDPGRPHVAFLALPDAGHPHADGHVLGLALAVPADMPDQDLTALLRAVLAGETLTEIQFAAGRPLALSYGGGRVSGLQPASWASADGAHEWVTVTPVMLDGHTRRGRDEASEVARSLVIAGYPEPAGVEASPAPMVTGGIWRPRPGTLPPGRPRRQMVHARVRFDQPVTGPVLAGSLRYLGLGLFLPVSRPPSWRPTGRPVTPQTIGAEPDATEAREPVGVAD